MLKALEEKIINCKNCELCNLKVNDNNLSDFGFGKLLGYKKIKNPDIMIIGLNPSNVRFKDLKYAFDAGKEKLNERAGHRLINVLKKLEIYERCYITNLVKCSTLDNKVKNKHAISCLTHLIKEIEILKPQIILAAGRQVYEFLIDNDIFVKRIYHPNYCYSYHKITEQQYINDIKEKIEK
jgi:uracil-DNA glycosylase family 4